MVKDEGAIIRSASCILKYSEQILKKKEIQTG
jgi:hypothetical protein